MKILTRNFHTRLKICQFLDFNEKVLVPVKFGDHICSVCNLRKLFSYIHNNNIKLIKQRKQTKNISVDKLLKAF